MCLAIKLIVVAWVRKMRPNIENIFVATLSIDVIQPSVTGDLLLSMLVD